MNIEDIVVNETDLIQARSLCAAIKDKNLRNRSIANVIAAKTASQYFDSELYSVDTESGLHNCALVLNDYDIADIYVNGVYIDVRFYFENGDLSVPKKHFDNKLLPVAYMFIRLAENLADASVTGFVLPDDIDLQKERGNYYLIDESILQPFSEIQSLLSGSEDTYDIDDIEIFDYLDGTLSDQAGFYQKLIKSQEGRNRFLNTLMAQNILCRAKFEKGAQSSVHEDEPDDGIVVDELLEVEDDNLEVIEQAEDNNEYDVIDELPEQSSDFEYSTEVTPSGADVIADLDNETSSTGSDVEAADADLTEENLQNTVDENVNEEQIETLFEDNNAEDEAPVVMTKRKSAPILPLVLILALAAGGGYYFYSQRSMDSLPEPAGETVTAEAPVENNDSAMPLETVEQPKNTNTNKNEGTAIAIPAIEKNLDASILVSNLKVDWEVPSGYVANTSAKRYLVKLGKIIQLNLKTELLLLSKPPITNKITVEIKYNDKIKKFETVGIVSSSGEQAVDDVILNTVNAALNMNISVNTDSFGKLQGNPVLIIRL